MAKFDFIAVKEGGQTIEASLEAADRLTAIATVRGQGLRLISLKERTAKKSGRQLLKGRGKRVKSDEIVIFTRQLSAMISAGVPIIRALTSMAKYAESATFRKAIEQVAKGIEGGEPFAEALSRHPSIFNDVYVNMVRAGEAAGILDEILKRLALQQEKNSAIPKC